MSTIETGRKIETETTTETGITKVLFLCPHGAAKSVFAAAYLAKARRGDGFEVEVSNAGVEPDPILLPLVCDRLNKEGLPLPGLPRLVSSKDLDWAELVVNIGCDTAAIPDTDKPILQWVVPDFSDDAAVAFASLESHVAELAANL